MTWYDDADAMNDGILAVHSVGGHGDDATVGVDDQPPCRGDTTHPTVTAVP
jgi:hypothetical protein